MEGTKKSSTEGFFRFVTFTAKPGSSVAEQAEFYRASPARSSHRSRTNRSKFPKIIDDTLRRELMHESEVPESFIRQYFCYVDENHDGRISAIVEMPDKHFDSSLAKAGLRTEVHMRKEQKFSLGSLESYSKELMRNLQDLMRKTEEEFLSGSLGKTNVEGLEMFLRSASNPESNGGFLLTSHGRGKDEINTAHTAS